MRSFLWKHIVQCVVKHRYNVCVFGCVCMYVCMSLCVYELENLKKIMPFSHESAMQLPFSNENLSTREEAFSSPATIS